MDNQVSVELMAAIIAIVLGVFKLLEWMVKQMYERNKNYLTDEQSKMINEIHTIITRDDGKGGSMVLSTSQLNNRMLMEAKEQNKEIKSGIENMVKAQEKMITTLDSFLTQSKEQTNILIELKKDINIMSGIFSSIASKLV